MLKKILLTLMLLNQALSYGQLSFCTGSTGAPVFLENFGSGTNYGPALATGVTNYAFVGSGFPQDGQYTLYYRTNLNANWLYSLDHTPDTDPEGVNGKSLIINASYTQGQFYKRTVTGLCSNTTFEFSAWLLNIYNSASNYCSGTGIPVNVTFEIWDATDTTLLQSVSTGSINGTSTPNWAQYATLFTMPAGQSAVILKMRNNGAGGCGNDLAIDDIMFRSCGESSSVINTSLSGNNIVVCENSSVTNPNLQVITTGTATHVYQWQNSTDNITYTDMSGITSTTFTIPTLLSATTYYRVKVAQDLANLNNSFCSILSDVYTVTVNPRPNAPVSNGNQNICSNQSALLEVSVNTNESVNWYDAAANGTLILANSLILSPTVAGSYYAETYNLSTQCISNTRTEVILLPLITVSYTGETIICSGGATAITFTSSDTSATINWTATTSDVTGILNGSGNTISETLVYTGNATGTIIYTITPVKNGCEGVVETVTVMVNPIESVALNFSAIPLSYCLNDAAPSLPTTSSNTPSVMGTWNPSAINTSSAGNTTYTFTPETSPCQNIQPYQLNITITNKNIPNFIDAISFCKGANSPVLNLTSPNGIPGTWIPTSINNSLSGIYVFTPNLDQCAVSQTINVTVFEPTLMSIDFTTNGAFAENQIVTILALDAGNYSYQLDDGILQESNVFTHVDSGIHTIKVIDKNGCSQPLSKDILIVSYPRFFTPNGDGFNDFWTIYGLNSLENPTVFIYDRYGKLIKQLKPNNIGWNGTLNGHSLPAADYWFTIDYEENNIFKTFRAHFSLIR